MTGAVQRALLAVADKRGLTEFAQGLAALGIEILSTGGTAQQLRDAGISVREVAEITEFPEMMGGRVKTLHPRIHGGILARRDVDGDLEALKTHSIPAIDLVVINLYPFESTVAQGASYDDAIEQIDIGGPAMIRAAAKNHAHVGVVVTPERYGSVLSELQEHSTLSDSTRKELALEALRRTAGYDAAISNWLGEQLEEGFPQVRTEQWNKMGDLRYGENPHQKAAWYQRHDNAPMSLADAEVLGGKALSYNNLLDAAAAIECARGLNGAGAVVVKHCLPCGAAERDDLTEAFRAAVAGDPLSAFGGIVALTQPVSVDLMRVIATKNHFFEVIHAPGFLPGALDCLRDSVKWGKNCRVLQGGLKSVDQVPTELRSLPGALLLQEIDRHVAPAEQFEVVSERQPNAEEWRDLHFAWKIVPHVRSNAILLASGAAVVGAGGGQPSRVDAAAIACRKAGERARGSALASDAFFPFPDGIEVAAKAGVTAIIQPGGSVRDGEAIEAANRLGLALVHTGERHFRH